MRTVFPAWLLSVFSDPAILLQYTVPHIGFPRSLHLPLHVGIYKNSQSALALETSLPDNAVILQLLIGQIAQMDAP